MSDIIEIIKKHQSATPSKWRDEALFRRENKDWLRISQYIAMFVLGIMEKKEISQKSLALKMDCSQQYISRILKGGENLSIETIVKILKALDVDYLSVLSFTLNRLSVDELTPLLDDAMKIKKEKEKIS